MPRFSPRIFARPPLAARDQPTVVTETAHAITVRDGAAHAHASTSVDASALTTLVVIQTDQWPRRHSQKHIVLFRHDVQVREIRQAG